MPVKLYAFTCGYLTLPATFILKGDKGRITLPIPSYLIVHPKGKVLFDSGLHIQTQADPLGYAGEESLRFSEFHFLPGEEISSRLSAMHIDPGEITHLINSHLHYDHAGGNAQIPNADLVVQRIEWDHAMALPDTDLAYFKKDFDIGQRRQLITGEHDLFGDGTVVCLPTYGHTPGHQSLRVRTENKEYILCGDACYLKESLEKLRLPGIAHDKEAMLAVFQRFREMQTRGATIMYGHDPEFWKSVPQGPIALA
jgi:N-acyl homoserine lactone hydrolase